MSNTAAHHQSTTRPPSVTNSAAEVYSSHSLVTDTNNRTCPLIFVAVLI